MLMYVSEGCQPTNRLFYVDLTKLDRTPQGTINFAAYDFFKGEPIMTHIICLWHLTKSISVLVAF